MPRASLRSAARFCVAGVFDWLWPADCRFCGTRLGLEPSGCRPLSALCPACLAGLPARWPGRWRPAEGAGAALLAYVEETRPLLLACKEGGDLALLARLAALWPAPPPPLGDGPAALVPVPSTAARGRQRGGDPVLELARGWGRAWRLPVLRPLRRRPGRAQKELGAADRAHNLRGAFRARRAPADGGPVLWLVDDVATTGATFDACAESLAAAGWRTGARLALFHTPRRRSPDAAEAAADGPFV